MTPMVRILQDLTFKNGGQVGQILAEFPIPEGATVENVVHDRMADHFEGNIVQGVRVIDRASGDEIYRWTRWDEQKSRSERSLKELCQTAQDEFRKRAGGSKNA
jgi:hypothetical protein